MKKYSFKILSLLLAAVVLASACACLGLITVTADDVYVTRTAVYDCNVDGTTGSASGNKYLMYNYNNSWVIESGTMGFIPLSYVQGKGCYEIWEQQLLTGFAVYTMNSISISDATLKEWYNFEGSTDGEEWYPISFVKDPDYKKVFGTGSQHASYKLSLVDIPEGTCFIKLSAPYDNGSAWNKGFLKVEIQYKELLPAPEITAEYKNLYGAFANKVENGKKVTRSVKLNATEIGAEEGGALTVLKNGAPVSADSLYNETEKGYIISQDGEYKIIASNFAGTAELEFTLANAVEDTVVTKTTIDDIYNTGKTTAYERIDTADATSKVVMSIAVSPGAHHIPTDKYYMYPYNHGKNEPAAYASWYSDIGFGTFFVDTLNANTASESFLRAYYSFLYSADGVNWTETEFEIGEKTTAGVGTSAVSYRLTVEKIPDDARYMRFLSLTTDASKHSGWCAGIIRAGYTSYVLMPEVNAYFEDALGVFSSPVANGATVPSKVKVGFMDVGAEINGKTTVMKDGTQITLPADGILTENGSYLITAENIKGKTQLSFTIDSSLAVTKSETYYFSEGVESAHADYEKLLGITPEGAPKDFTKGDGHVIVNDTGILKYSDNLPWWGLTEGGTKLATGSDSKGYTADGHFYFVNVGSDGEKYTGISITYTAAIQAGYPKNAHLSVYSADKYNGTYRLITPSSVTMEPYTGTPAAAVYHATYYLGTAGSVVKIEFHPDAPAAQLWKGGFLSILNLSKLSMPLVEAVADEKVVVNNAVAQSDVKINVSGELYSFVTKDGESFEFPADGKLTQDGYYTVTACNYAGVSSVSFYIAREIPVIRLIDSSGNYMSDGQKTVDDVKAIFYNCDTASTTLNGELVSDKKELTADLNGSYVFKGSNKLGEFEMRMVLERPLPTVKAYNFQSKEIQNGEVIVTSATFSIATADKYTVTLDGKTYEPETSLYLDKEGVYVITAENKAGITELQFAIKYNPPLPKVEHKGDTVVKLDYQKTGRTSWNDKYVYSNNNITLDDSKALQSGWTGFTGGVLHSLATSEDAQVIYKHAPFKSFAIYFAYLPEKGVEVTDIYDLQYSVNGTDYLPIECDIEHDISYITTGYKLYRYTAKALPENTKYIKVTIKQENASSPWSRCIKGIEFGYNKADIGKLDVEDLIFMLGDIYDGDSVSIDLYNSNNDVIPKKVFDAIKESDKTLNINLLDKDGQTEYVLSFNGLSVTEGMDFAVGVTNTDTNGSKLIKKQDSKASALVLRQQGPWTMSVTVGKMLGRRETGNLYSLYMYKDGEFSLVASSSVDNKGVLSFELIENGDYTISGVNDLLDEEDEQIEDTPDQDTVIEGQKGEKKGTYIMVVNRKKFVPYPVETSIIPIVIIISAAVLILAIAVTVTVIVIKKKKMKG